MIELKYFLRAAKLIEVKIILVYVYSRYRCTVLCLDKGPFIIYASE
jgi:hypothetical protein